MPDTLCCFRTATAKDAKRFALMAASTFRATFEAANSPEDMNDHCARSFGEHLQASEIADPDFCTLLCEIDGRLAGFGQLRRAATPSCVAAQKPIELYRLYVDPRWHGMGVAQALIAEILGRASQDRAEQIWLGVWEHNPRAIAFYEKCGFVEVGSQVFMIGDDRQRDLVMMRALETQETHS